MSEQERRVDELADVIDVWWEQQDEPTIFHDGVDHVASIPLAQHLIAAGYEKRPERDPAVATWDEIRKQVRG